MFRSVSVGSAGTWRRPVACIIRLRRLGAVAFTKSNTLVMSIAVSSGTALCGVLRAIVSISEPARSDSIAASTLAAGRGCISASSLAVRAESIPANAEAA